MPTTGPGKISSEWRISSRSFAAWWQERQDRDDVRLVLSSLAEELRNFVQEEKNNEVYISAIRESAGKLLSASTMGGESLSTREIDHLLADIVWLIRPVDNSYPVFNSLMASGNISLISNANLRQQLAVLHSEYAAFNSELQSNLEFILDIQMPFLDKNSNLVQIGSVVDAQPGFTNTQFQYEKYESTTTTDHSHLINNAEFQNILMRKTWLLTDIDEFRSPRLYERLNSIIALIELELAK